MDIAKLQNVAGRCSNFCTTTRAAIDWVRQNLKIAGTAAWETLKKTAFFVSCFFAKAAVYLYQGALLIKGAAVQGFSIVKSYVANHPREIKIAAVGAGIGIAFAALIYNLCSRSSSSDRPSATYQPIPPEETILPSHLAATGLA